MADFTSKKAAGEDFSQQTRILVRARDGLRVYLGPPSVTPESGEVEIVVDESSSFTGLTGLRLSPLYSPDGSVVCIVREAGLPLCLHESVSGHKVGEISCLDAQSVDFSPRGTFLVTWSRAVKGTAEEASEGNFRVWRVSDGSLLVAYSQKTQKRDALQWTLDEQLCLRCVTNEINVMTGNDLRPLAKIHHKGVTQFRVSPTLSSAPGCCNVAVFTPEGGGKPARASLYHYPGIGATEVQGPGATRTMFSASEASMLWNSQGTSVLVHTHSDLDTTNTSYYGMTGLYVLTTPALGEITEKVAQSKDGPIHDVKWSPAGDRFVLAAGNMPSHTTLYSHKAEMLFEFGAAHRNTISWSPHARFLCIAGFGNLAGEMDFYDMAKMKKTGSNSAHCSVSHGWSPGE